MEQKPHNGIFQRLSNDAFKFIIVGCISYAVDFSVFLMLKHMVGFDRLQANPISRFCGGLISFTLNKFWTFRRTSGQTKTSVQFLRYWTVWVTMMATSEVALLILGSWLRIPDTIAKPMGDGLAGLISFIIQRHWTFR